MSDTTVSVSIRGTDELSPVFRKVSTSAKEAGTSLKDLGRNSSSGLEKTGTAAKKAGDSLEAMGKDADKASRDLEKAAKAADKAETGFEKINKTADSAKKNLTALGAAGGLIAGGMAKVGQAAETQRRQVLALEKSYGSAGQAAEQFARELSSSTRFSLEDTQESMRIMATLYNNYGVSLEQIQTLMQQTADLATVTGISLADAAQRTSSAIRGEAESAEFLGLTMNQAAIDRENLTLKMSNQEAAQFRLNALTEQAAFAQGAATESVQTTAGAIDQLSNRMGQAAIAVGDFLGPIGQVAAPMADFAIMLPVAGAALVDLADGMDVGAKGAKLLQAAISPLGVSIGVLTGTLVAVLAGHANAAAEAESQAASYENLELAIQGVDSALARMHLRQSGIDLSSDVQQAMNPIEGLFDLLGVESQLVTSLEDDYEALRQVREANNRATMEEMNARTESINWLREYRLNADEAQKIIDNTTKSISLAGEQTEEYAATAAKLNEAHLAGTLDNNKYVESIEDITKALEYAGPGQEKYREILQDTFEDLNSGAISVDEFNKRIDILSTNAVRYGEMLAANKKPLADYAQMEQEAAAAARESAEASRELAQYRGLSVPQQMMTAINEQTIAYHEEQAAIKAVRAERELNVALYALEQRSIAKDIQMNEQARDAMLANIDTSTNYGQRLRDIAKAAYEAEGGAANHKEAMDAADAAMKEHEENAKALADTFRGTLVPGIDGASDAIQSFIPPGNDWLDVLAEMDSVSKSAGANFTELADNISDAGEALDAALSVFSSIDALGQRSAQAANIGKNLVGDPGVWAPIDDMMVQLNDRYNANQISLEQLELAQSNYNAAVEAGYRVQQNDWAIQNDLQQIRAAQLPWMAERQEAYAQYINDLTTANAEEQRHALYLMDTANQAKLATIESIRHAEALGEIDTRVATDLIVNSAQADPILAEILEQYGIIEVGAEGEITVAWTDGDATTQAVQALTDSVDALTIAMGGIPPIRVDPAEAVKAAEQVNWLTEELEQLGGLEVGPEISFEGLENLDQDAVNQIFLAIRELDGASATITVNDDGTITVTRDGVEEVKGAVENADGTSANVSVNEEGATEAKAEVDSAAEAVENANGKKATMTVETVYAEPGGSPMSGEDMTGKATPTLIPVEAYIMKFDTSLVDDWEPAEQAVDAKVLINVENLDRLLELFGNMPEYPIKTKVEVNTEALDTFETEHTVTLTAELDTSKIGEVSHIKPPTLPVIIDPKVDEAKMTAISNIDLPKVPVIITPKADDAGFAAIGNIDLPKLLVSISPQVDATGFAALKDIEIPKIPVIISPQVDDSGFAAVSNIELPKVPVIISPQVDDAGFAAVSDIQLPKVPVIISPQVDDAGMAALGNLQIPEIPVTVNIQYATMGEMPELPELSNVTVSVDIQVNDAAFSSAQNAVNEFGRMTATATLEATDGASSKIEAARQTAMNFIQTYSAGLAVTDGASNLIRSATATGQAFATTYTGTIAAADQATAVIGTAQGQATAFVNTYSATITAVDNASGIIQSVRNQLDALNGTTAITYVQTVQQGGVGPAMMHGGMVKPDVPFRIPHAAHGRGVMVGEAGPELALLPYGTLVQPHGASMARKESSGAGTEMAEAFTLEILAERTKAEDAGEKLAEAAASGMKKGARKYDSGNSVEDTGFRIKNIRGPQSPPAELPKNATEKQERRHERQTERYEGQLDKAIDRATEQWQEAPDPASRKQAMEILARLLRTQMQFEAAEERREALAERAARKEEEAAKKQEESQRKAAEAATETATATESIADGAGVASGAIAKLQEVMAKLNGTSEQTLDTATTGMQDLSKSAQQAASDVEQVGQVFPSDAHGEIDKFGDQLSAITEGNHVTELQAIGKELQEIGNSSSDIDTSRLRELASELDALAASGADRLASVTADTLIRWADGIDQAKRAGAGELVGEFNNVSKAALGAANSISSVGDISEYVASRLQGLQGRTTDADAILSQLGNNESIADVADDIDLLASSLENMNGAIGVSDLVLDITGGLRDVAAAARDGSIDINTLARTLEGLGQEISEIDGGASRIDFFDDLGGAATDLAADMRKLPASLKSTEKAMGSLVKDTNQASNALTRLGNRDVSPSVELNTAPFEKNLDDVYDDGKKLEQTSFIPDASLNRDTWDRIYTDITKKMDIVDRETVKPSISADKSKFESTMTTIKNTDYKVTVDVVYKDQDGNTVPPSKLSTQNITTKMHGGQIRATARHGRAIMTADMLPRAQHGLNVLVGEAGPEIVNLPIGSMVHTNPASRSRMEGTSGGNESFHFHGPVYFQVKDNNAMDAVRRYVRNEGF